MNTLRTLSRVVNFKSVLIAALAFASTLFCMHFKIVADFPLTLIATAIVFPLVFSISTAYNRREKALEEYGALKAHGRSLYLASRDWGTDPKRSTQDGIRDALRDLLQACRDLVTGPQSDALPQEARVYRCFSRLSESIKDLRADGVAATEISRASQYLARMMSAFENIRNIYDYRTPRTLRAFSDFFILILPILYGPYFAYQAQQFRSELFWVMPILFALILVGLSNIQDHLENPFDQIGEDDVAIDPQRFADSLLTEEERAAG